MILFIYLKIKTALTAYIKMDNLIPYNGNTPKKKNSKI